MKKWLVLVVLWQIVVAGEAEAGIFGGRRLAPRSSGGTIYFDSLPPKTVDSLPAHGSIKIQYGWYYEFRSTGPYRGTWYPTHPVGENPRDYRDGEPVHGAVRYKNGLRYTYDSRQRLWISDWYYP